MAPMDIQSARDFVASNHRGILLTYRSGGAPQMSPIIAGSTPRAP